ncbi:hypothetical protein AMS68_007768 [Peltaster fructicola]|uniref:WW domain-containing protein n=1 Tax=Peltaster fructicola TaxID=286661 RepID=A0A6H0Y5P7_9PEZI|nr:hypothetical protein AMS68_007768 [Peltaster fructicola]
MWKAAQAGDGRQYYYNTATNATTWEKPEDFDEQASAASPQAATANGTNAGAWKEAVNQADGRTYYYNTVTNATTWEKPAGFVQSQIPSTAVALNGDSHRRLIQRDSFRDASSAHRGGFERPSANTWETRNAEGSTFRGARADEPEHANAADAEVAFFKFLRLNDIKYDTEWRDAIAKLGREKGFRAFKDPWERKQAFDKYCAAEQVAEKSREQERKQKQREQFKSMLKLHDEIKHYTRWKSALPLIERELVFKSVSDDQEREQIFREYIMDLQDRHARVEAETYERALSELASLMRTLVVSSDIKWEDALSTIEGNSRFVNDRSFRALHKLDILKTYEAHIRNIDAGETLTNSDKTQPVSRTASGS